MFYHRDVRPGLTDTVIAACERSGFRPRVSQETPQLTSTLNLVAAGLSVSIVPESLRHLRTNDIAFLRLTGDAPQAAPGLASRVDERSAAVGNFIAVALGMMAIELDDGRRVFVPAGSSAGQAPIGHPPSSANVSLRVADHFRTCKSLGRLATKYDCGHLDCISLRSSAMRSGRMPFA